MFSPISTPIKQITTAPSTVSNLTDIESCGRQHSASVFTVPVIIEAIVKIPKYDKHIIAARGAEPREFLPARYPHDAEEAAKANQANAGATSESTDNDKKDDSVVDADYEEK